jgi:predicted amidohydrolase
MPRRFRAACVQTTSGRDYDPNLAQVVPMIEQARRDGADLVLLPENVSLLEPDPARLRLKALPEVGHPVLSTFSDLARDLGVWLLVGSIAICVDDNRFVNRSYLIAADGSVAAHYDKMHLFDVDLEGGESYRESATFTRGQRAVVAPTPWGGMGLSICYDLRFPTLYRHLAKAGADLLTIPSAFTRITGQAHWHILVRARAIENACFVFAPAQCGVHAEGRTTFGHSLIVDPWGTVLAEGGDDPTVIAADIDLEQVQRARRRVPSLALDTPL